MVEYAAVENLVEAASDSLAEVVGVDAMLME